MDAVGKEDTAAVVISASFISVVCELLITDLVSSRVVTPVATAIASVVAIDVIVLVIG